MMSTILLNTPDSSSRDSSTISTPSAASAVAAAANIHNNDSPIAITNNENNNIVAISTGIAGPPSPRASDTAIVVPRRIFVGGFPPLTTEHELRSYFEKFGCVRDVKIIRDHTANAKGKYSYGFVTFETDEEAKKLIMMGKAEGTRAFEFRGRYLNVNEAVKKPPFNKTLPLDSVPPSGVVLRDVHGQLFTIQNGYAVIANPDAYAIAQPQPLTPTFPFVVQHPVYFAATAPPAPIKYAHQAGSFAHVPPTPASAPALPHANSVPPHMLKARFVFPPLANVPQAPYNGNQLGHLPPTPIASPVNADSPSKTVMSNFNGSNPAITNLTNPFPSVLGSSSQAMPPSPYRWTTSTVAGPVTQLVYPGGYPTFLHELGHSYSLQQQQPQQQQSLPPSAGNGFLSGFYSSDLGDYNSCSTVESLREVPSGCGDRRQSKNPYRLDASASLKD